MPVDPALIEAVYQLLDERFRNGALAKATVHMENDHIKVNIPRTDSTIADAIHGEHYSAWVYKRQGNNNHVSTAMREILAKVQTLQIVREMDPAYSKLPVREHEGDVAK